MSESLYAEKQLSRFELVVLFFSSRYAIMKDCWNQFPPRRPSFSILRHRMIAILDEPGDDVYVDQMSDNAFSILENPPGEKC